MARSFGSTGASSLIRAATAAANKVNALNDASAAFEFDVSAKTAEDFDKYQKYLDGRVAATKNADPTKALSLTRTAVSANRSFNSAEIGRATTDVKFGNMSSRDKYDKLTGLWQAAQSNGDDNLAQSLYGQLASLSVQIQNEDQAAASAGEAANNKQLAANKRGVDEALRNYEEHVKIAKDLVEQGKLSINDYQRIAGEAALGKADLLQKASSGEIGGLSEDAMSAYADKHVSLTTDDGFKKAVALAGGALNGAGSQYLNVDPALKNADGTNYATLQDLPKGINTVDASGNVIKQFPGGWQGKEDQKARETAIAGGSPYIFPQVGTGSAANVTSNVGGAPIKDAKGNYFVVDQNGKKHYVTTDPNSLLQRSTEPIDPNAQPYGPTTTAGQVGQNFKNVFGTILNTPKTLLANPKSNSLLSKIPLLGSFVRRNNAAQEAIRQSAELKKQQDSYAAYRASETARIASQNAANSKLLPVFQKPVAPAPTPVAQVPKLAPLPGQPGYVSGVTKVQQVIKDPNSTAFNAVEALRGGIY